VALEVDVLVVVDVAAGIFELGPGVDADVDTAGLVDDDDFVDDGGFD